MGRKLGAFAGATIPAPKNPAVPVTHSASNVPKMPARPIATFSHSASTAPPKTDYAGRIPRTPRPRRNPTRQRVTRPRPRRCARKSTARGDPSQAEDPDPEPVARFDGFAVASRRMHEHLCRRTAKAAAA
jgi:hypothetical protein